MLVDLACIGAVVYLAIKGVREPAVWSILSGLMIGRFGISHSKTMERSNRSSSDGGGGGGGGGSGSWGRRDLAPIPPTEERDPNQRPTPRPIPREDPPRRAGLSARQRLTVWIARRRAAPSMPWWTRRAVSIPFTGFRVDAVSLAVLAVLVVTLATLATAGRSSASSSSPVDETNGATAHVR
jgi:hypothetical protein